jgi:hypothetical protein
MREDGLDTLVTSSGVDFLKRLKKSGRPGLILNMHGAHWCAVQWDTETANNEDALWIANSLKETIHKISVSDFRDEFVAGLVITDIGQPADYDVDICKELDTLVGSGFGIVRHFLSLKLPFLK